MKSKKTKITQAVSALLLSAFSVALAMSVGIYSFSIAPYIHDHFNTSPTVVVAKEDAEEQDTQYYKMDYEDSNELMQAKIDYIRKSVGEGTVLLKNENDALPISATTDGRKTRVTLLGRASTDLVRQAIEATRGQVLMSEGRICDARFSKCCGGAYEEFQYCWQDTPYPYLLKQRDWRVRQGDKSEPAGGLPDLTVEAEADRWIRTSPEAFCNTTDKRILSQVLNNYDQETTDFYRWRVDYTQQELADLIRQRSGVDYGQIIDLVPVARGTSGRLWKLKIVGTKRTCTIGKELEIRRTLSPSHLYSSAFVVDRHALSPEGIPQGFTLTGAGWGHGVGLCQIGAAVMGEQGYPYDEILLHYYIGASIEKIYT